MDRVFRELTEGKIKDFDAKVAKIAEMTDENDHGGSILAAAKLVGDKKVADRVKLVMKLHMLEGHMPMELLNYRRGLYKEMLATAKKKLSKDDLETLHGAF